MRAATSATVGHLASRHKGPPYRAHAPTRGRATAPTRGRATAPMPVGAPPAGRPSAAIVPPPPPPTTAAGGTARHAAHVERWAAAEPAAADAHPPTAAPLHAAHGLRGRCGDRRLAVHAAARSAPAGPLHQRRRRGGNGRRRARGSAAADRHDGKRLPNRAPAAAGTDWPGLAASRRHPARAAGSHSDAGQRRPPRAERLVGNGPPRGVRDGDLLADHGRGCHRGGHP